MSRPLAPVPSRASPRILFLQFTNPAGYPPLEHASRILAERGWEARFVGTGAYGADTLRFPEHPAIRVWRMPATRSGALQKIAYVTYVAWALAACLTWRPRWIYASEPMATLPALIGCWLVRCRVVYHEHDSPSYAEPVNAAQRLLRWARTRLAKRADVCILPQEYRLKAFVAETGRRAPTYCVWNTPRREEVASPRPTIGARPLRFYYHGSLNSGRLPLSVLKALRWACSKATLTIVGYETVGSIGYMQRFMSYASQLDIGDRITFRGALPDRAGMLREASHADVGLAFMPMDCTDINVQHIVGASNKPFDYMAVGLMPLVSDLPDWRTMYVEPGFARACDPGDIDSLVAAMTWCIEHPEKVREMGETGRQHILREWSYEQQFADVYRVLEGLND